MQLAGGILSAALLIVVLIAFHEAGHLMAAKLVGVPVHEFSIGMGRTLWTHQSAGGTWYSLRLLPLGGYCSFDDEDVEWEDSCFVQAPAWKRLIVALAGPLFNFILAFVIGLGIVWGCGISVSGNEVAAVSEDGVCAKVLMPGDRIEKVAGVSVQTAGEIRNAVSDWYTDHSEEKLSVEVTRDSKKQMLEVSFPKNASQPVLGIEMASFRARMGLKEGVLTAARMTVENTARVLEAFIHLFQNPSDAEQMSGVIGAVAIIGQQTAQNGISDLLGYGLFLSVNLFVFNLLPLPILDGAKILTALIELIVRKKVPVRVEEKLSQWFMILFLVFFGWITGLDLERSLGWSRYWFWAAELAAGCWIFFGSEEDRSAETGTISKESKSIKEPCDMSDEQALLRPDATGGREAGSKN